VTSSRPDRRRPPAGDSRLLALAPALSLAALLTLVDSVFDTVGADGRFGEERLQHTVAGVGDAVDAVARIDEALSHFEVGEQADDTAVLAVQRAVVPAAIGGGSAGARKNEPER